MRTFLRFGNMGQLPLPGPGRSTAPYGNGKCTCSCIALFVFLPTSRRPEKSITELLQFYTQFYYINAMERGECAVFVHIIRPFQLSIANYPKDRTMGNALKHTDFFASSIFSRSQLAKYSPL